MYKFCFKVKRFGLRSILLFKLNSKILLLLRCFRRFIVYKYNTSTSIHMVLFNVFCTFLIFKKHDTLPKMGSYPDIHVLMSFQIQRKMKGVPVPGSLQTSLKVQLEAGAGERLSDLMCRWCLTSLPCLFIHQSLKNYSMYIPSQLQLYNPNRASVISL